MLVFGLVLVSYKEVVLVMLEGITQLGVALVAEVCDIVQLLVESSEQALVVDALSLQEV
jgi:hypothetical protein